MFLIEQGNLVHCKISVHYSVVCYCYTIVLGDCEFNCPQILNEPLLCNSWSTSLVFIRKLLHEVPDRGWLLSLIFYIFFHFQIITSTVVTFLTKSLSMVLQPIPCAGLQSYPWHLFAVAYGGRGWDGRHSFCGKVCFIHLVQDLFIIMWHTANLW